METSGIFKLLPMSSLLLILIIIFLNSSTQQHLAYGTSLLQQTKVNMTQENNNCCVPILLAPISTSANNVYMIWTNNDTGHWKVLLAKSGDGGRTFKTIVLSAPNLRGHVVHENAQIAASGSTVYITWWTNQSGTFIPVFRASNDSGNTFGKTLILNSTGR